MSATFKNTTNITEQARAVINAHRDIHEFTKRDKNSDTDSQKKLYNAHSTDSTKSILNGELVFSNKKTDRRSNKRKLNRISDCYVYSSFNGISTKSETRVDEDELRKIIKKDIVFMGVSELTSNHKHGVHNDDEVVVQVGGTRTIINNGDGPVNVGDLIMWDLPTPSEHQHRIDYPGVSNSKVLPQIKVYDSMVEDAWDKVKKNKDDIAVNSVGPGELLKSLNTYEKMRDDKQCIIGKAVSSAAPGKPFDIILGNHVV